MFPEKFNTNDAFIDNEREIKSFLALHLQSYFDFEPINESHISDFLNDNRKISGDHKVYLDSDFSTEEIFYAIKEQKKKKSPGIDGLTVEFFDVFKSQLLPHLRELFNNIYNGKVNLPLSWTMSAIKLIPKKGNLSENINDWRPINICNTDTKIFTKAIMNRLSTFADTIISQNQACGIKGRNIFDQISLADFHVYNANK